MTGERRLRCAIYTRRSSDEGLEQSFNSLDAQREACEAYVRSQAHQEWATLRTTFDDAGYSGGNMNRPALRSLLAMIEAAAVDVVVVYKIDRLTRSLTDFAKIAEILERQKVSLVSITQQFDTVTPLGQLALNVLLSFAQFERELTGERIREKIAASKRHGMWMGGMPPIGYDAIDGRLVVNAHGADTVRRIFSLYLEEGTVPRLARRLQSENIHTAHRYSAQGAAHGNRPFSRGHLPALLSNPIYVGRVAHKEASYPGQHEPLIERGTWQAVQARLATNAQEVRDSPRRRPALSGLLVSERGRPFHHAHASKRGRRYRYYVEKVATVLRPVRLPADEIEEAVTRSLRTLLADERKAIERLGGAEPAHLPRALAAIRLLRRELASPRALERARAALRRVEYHRDRLALTVSVPAARRLAGLPDVEGDRTLEFEVTTVKPAARRGRRRMKVVVAEGELPPKDLSFVAAVVRARAWADRLIAGEVQSVAEICRNGPFSESYVRKVLPLAFLPPTAVEAMLSDLDEARLMECKRTTQIGL